MFEFAVVLVYSDSNLFGFKKRGKVSPESEPAARDELAPEFDPLAMAEVQQDTLELPGRICDFAENAPKSVF